MMKALLASLTIAALAAPALAQQPTTTTPAEPKSATEDAFIKHDTDEDGALSIAEVKVADATLTDTDFATYDADKDKALSKMEFAM